MQKIQLSIPEPCHQSWHQMTPAEQGRYCNACAKVVVDFSMMTDTEVLNYFTTSDHEKVCGRALPSQLDRTIMRPKVPAKRLFWYWNYIVMFLLFFAKGNMARAQGNVKAMTGLNPVSSNDMYKTPVTKSGEAVISDSILISGKVMDRNGKPVSYASVKIKGTATGFSADVHGKYTVKVKRSDILIISGASFLSAEHSIGNHTSITTVLQRSVAGDIEVSGVSGGIRYTNPDEEKIKG
ncbi:MAG: carboxypeptidase-like regulatory domain-containing protein [Chitinophagaceae bacterium]|nr:carboxypeptidase-like regulatory domain-containing protein [Chitinophagaceae bacterium]